MAIVSQFLVHTPWWVYFLFAYLVTRGIKGLTPGYTTLPKVAIIPLAFTIWCLAELARLYGLAADAVAIWIAGLAVGGIIGYVILRNAAITVDPATGIMHRPADFTLLPLIILIFAAKYTFAAIGTTSPGLLMEPGFRIADLGLSGLFTGTFVGKFTVYASRYLTARAKETTT